jgi:Protein of unknown function (DUF2726)
VGAYGIISSMIVIFIAAGILLTVLLVAFILKNSETESVEEILPFRLKQRFFSQSEFVLHEALLQELDQKRFVVFSKVRLADFIETTAIGKEYYTWFNKIKSKHIDFLIWDTKKNIIALGIELDGKTHESSSVMKRDDFVNRLYKQINFPIKRIQVGKNFAEEARIIKSEVEID